MQLSKVKKFLPALIVLSLVVGVSATGDYLRSKRVEPSADFIGKIQLAEVASKQIELENFISSETAYKEKSKFGFGIVCKRGYYQTQTMSGNGTWCKQGFSKFYGLSSVDKAKLESLYNYIQDKNWQPHGEAGSIKNLEQAVLDLNDRVGSVYFKNNEGLTAQLLVARTDMKDSGSLCTATLCQLADQHKKYAAIAEVFIYYETKPFD